MKFVNYLERITNISIYPLISLVLFVAFFTVVTLYVFRTPKKTMEEKGHIPLEQ